jgi:hypothetical protein
VEGIGKRVVGAHGVGVELGAVSGFSEGDRGGSLHWQNDGSVMAQWQQRGGGGKWVIQGGGGAPFIDGGGG